MEKSNALLIIGSRKVISSPSKITAKVTSCTPYNRVNESGPNQVAICNFNVMTPYHLEAAKTLFAQGDFQKAVNQQMSSSIREGEYIPVKGETVDLIIEELTTSNGVTGLFITTILEKKAVAPKAIDMSDFLGVVTGLDMLEETPVFSKETAKA